MYSLAFRYQRHVAPLLGVFVEQFSVLVSLTISLSCSMSRRISVIVEMIVTWVHARRCLELGKFFIGQFCDVETAAHARSLRSRHHRTSCRCST